jgi:8-oxo-dGTP diphosphatase
MRPYNCYLTADSIIVSGNDVVLVRRKNEPFRGMWCFPGGFIEPEEGVLNGAKRELFEETAISGIELEPFGVYGDPGRDPRGRTVTVVYWSIVEHKPVLKAGDDAAECSWFALNQLPPMAFDHSKIAEDLLRKLQERRAVNVR